LPDATWARTSAMPCVVSSLMVMPSSFSTRLNHASRCAFWKAPPQDETVIDLCCASAVPPSAMAAQVAARIAQCRVFIVSPPP